MRSLLAVALVVALALPALPPAGAYEDGAPLVVEGTVHSRADGAPLAATLYQPEACPCPAILMTHGWGGSRADLDALARGYAEQGYVVLTWDARGWGGSSVAVTGHPGGVVSLDGPLEVEDALTMVDVLGGKEFLFVGDVAVQPLVWIDDATTADPRVGMRGVSYGGGIQLLAAEADDRIDAIVPEITWHDLRTSLFPAGVLKEGYVDLLFASGQAYPYGRGVMHPDLARWWADAHDPTSDHAGVFEALRIRSAAAGPAALDLPVLLVQGLDDPLFTPAEAQANYDAVLAAGGEARVVLVPGGHGGVNVQADPVVTAEVDAWFACHVRERHGCLDRPASGSVVVATPDGVREFAEWPRLHPEVAGIADDYGFYESRSTPVPTSHTAFHQVERTSPVPSFDLNATLFTFERTGAENTSLQLTGTPVFTLEFTWCLDTPPCAEGPAFLKLVDIAPDGSYVAVHDQVSVVDMDARVTSADFGWTTIWWHEMPMVPTDHVFAPGHDVGVVLALSDSMYTPQEPAHLRGYADAQLSVH